ncbi:acyl-CoA dehydrogenase family protein [Pseudomonas typographi]|uniref:acyl-CoA dehydrogenase family protein n=1 Tax=Pseudomonas typographi TaxID=2715964 RepID=UPI0016887682|nr:acyl-CoA dehydrogenase family protein [Pseudomonas typographi]MBD1551487.1 acyl-CoA/acyl-ACP dehydrogenase [Pseudomonas typographi]
MNFSLSAEQARVRELARDLAREAFAARAKHYDTHAQVPLENLADLRSHGLLGLVIGRDVGGAGGGIQGQDPLAYLLALEQIAQVCLATSHCLQVHCHAAHYIDQAGSREQRERILGDVITNGALMTTLGSEPGRTARGARNQTTAQARQGGWQLDGVKNYATLASASTYLLVLADCETDGRVAAPDGQIFQHGERVALAVAVRTPGVNVLEGSWDPLGMRAAVSPTVSFDGCAVSWANTIGGSNTHFSGHWSVKADLGFAAQYVGASEGILQRALAAVNRRGTAGDAHVQRHLGRLRFAIDGARGLLYRAAWLWAQGEEGIAAQASLGAKHQALVAAQQLLEGVVQIVGPSHFAATSVLARQYRDLRFLSMREHLDRTAAQVGAELLQGRAPLACEATLKALEHGA